jgi:hypothetical protein
MKASHPLPKRGEEVSFQGQTVCFLLNNIPGTHWKERKKEAFPLPTHWDLENDHYLLILKLKFHTCNKNLR